MLLAEALCLLSHVFAFLVKNSNHVSGLKKSEEPFIVVFLFSIFPNPKKVSLFCCLKFKRVIGRSLCFLSHGIAILINSNFVCGLNKICERSIAPSPHLAICLIFLYHQDTID